MHAYPLLSLAIWMPIAFGVLVLGLGILPASFASNTLRSSQNWKISDAVLRWIALTGAVLSFAVTLPLWTHFDIHATDMQFVEHVAWIGRFNIFYSLGIDGISLWLVVLTALTTVIVVVAAWEVITKHVAAYLGAFLILSGLMVGVFCAQDGLLFYVFFEATLIPMYLIIGIWGGPSRVYAAFKFFLYTLMGSLLMLVALLYLYAHSGSFALAAWQPLPIPLNIQILLFIAFFMAFAVKVPMWPVHTWLPDAHVEAPTGGSVVLAAIMLKLGAYGFLRFSLPITPDASHFLAPVIVVLSLIAVIYIGLVAIAQQDMKKLVAYSSIAHMGMVTLGFFLFTPLALEGAIVQMISHGLVSGAMFLCIGVLYDRMHSRQIADYGGVINVMPKFAAFSVFFAMANAGLPGTSGFVGEFMVILAAVHFNFWIGLLAALTLVLGAAYTLWMVKRVYFGPVANENVAKLTDLNCRERGMLAALAILVLAFGLYPKPITQVMHVAAGKLILQTQQSKLGPS